MSPSPSIPNLVQWSDLEDINGERMVLIGGSHYPRECAVRIARGVAALLDLQPEGNS